MKSSEVISLLTEMLVRIPIQRAQRVLYKFAIESTDRSFRRSEARNILEFDSKQFHGVLSALSRRINGTPGLAELRPGWSFVFTSRSIDDDDDEFVAVPEVLEAIRGIPELLERLSESWEVVRDGPEFRLDRHQTFDVSGARLEEDLDEIRSDLQLAETERARLVQARIGQGKFRERVARIERSCRVTHVSDLQHLRASHIKPWRVSSNEERLDGANGLLLAPHIDHLFDRGFISFSNDGTLLVSSQLDDELRETWAIASGIARPFTVEQIRYLSHHRDRTFRK